MASTELEDLERRMESPRAVLLDTLLAISVLCDLRPLWAAATLPPRL
jgi:hypothetical protein